jgi:glycosyltransferase involved in cell wall biosynthesis
MKIAMIAPYPANAVLPPEYIRPKYRQAAHPASWVRSLCSALSRRADIEIRVFSIGRDVLHHRVVQQDGFEVEYIPQRSPARLDWCTARQLKIMQIRPYVRRYRPDLVHGFGMETGNATMALAMGFPATAFIQGIVSELLPYIGWSPLHKKMACRLERIAVQRLNGMVAETGFAERWAKSQNPAAHVAVIPHAVNQEFLAAGHPDFARPHFLTVGTLSEIKGTGTVIRALAQMDRLDVRLRIAGCGPLRSMLESLATSLGVRDQVDFLGHIPRAELIHEMNRASALVIASRMDTSPNVVTEAHAVGIPVIGTRAGGIPDMVSDEEDGFLVPVDDAATMADRMKRLLADNELCRRMGAAGREKVKVLNDPDQIADAHIRFFKNALRP